jgi:hypothetical protein
MRINVDQRLNPGLLEREDGIGQKDLIEFAETFHAN